MPSWTRRWSKPVPPVLGGKSPLVQSWCLAATSSLAPVTAGEELRDPTAHAEILVLGAAGRKTGDWRLENATLYVTLEPCPMCLEACRHARLALVVWGTPDPVMGACGSVLDAAEDPRLHPPVAQRGGLSADTASKLLKEFFAKKRLSS